MGIKNANYSHYSFLIEQSLTFIYAIEPYYDRVLQEFIRMVRSQNLSVG